MTAKQDGSEPKSGLSEGQPHYHGHRERLRARFREAGAEAVSDYKLLELVLFRAIPQRDVKPLAKELIAKFGSFAEVVAAPVTRLAEVKGQALRRGEMYHRAGSDMLFIHSRDPEELRRIGERLPPPLMMFVPEDGFGSFEMSPADLATLGFRLAASSGTAFAAMHKAARQSYEYLARGEIDPFLGAGGAVAEMKRAQQTTGLATLLEIEKRTTERVG